MRYTFSVMIWVQEKNKYVDYHECNDLEVAIEVLKKAKEKSEEEGLGAVKLEWR